MAGGFSRQDGALSKASKMVQDAKGDLDQQLSQLRGKLEGIGSQWQGAGATAFHSAMQRWDEDARKIISALNEFEANLSSADSTYTSSDQDQQAKFSKLGAQLGG